MNIEEANEKIEKLNDEIESLQEQLQQSESDLDDVNYTCDDLRVDNSILEEFRDDKESMCEKAFKSGYSCAADDGSVTVIKGWLNYKIEARL